MVFVESALLSIWVYAEITNTYLGLFFMVLVLVLSVFLQKSRPVCTLTRFVQFLNYPKQEEDSQSAVCKMLRAVFHHSLVVVSNQ